MALSPKNCENLIYFYLSSSCTLLNRLRYSLSATFAGLIGLLSYSIRVLFALISFGNPVLICVFFIVIGPVWETFNGPVAARGFWFWVDGLCDYLLGLLRRGWGVFLLYSPSLRGASFDDLILFDRFRDCFCAPEPTILMGRGWKSNCWMTKKTSATEVNLATGTNVISTVRV